MGETEGLSIMANKRMYLKKVMMAMTVAAMLVGCGAATVQAKEPVEDGYTQILDELRDELPMYDPKGTNNTAQTPVGYVLYDIDKDGTPEMLVKRGSCEADYTLQIYGQTGSGFKLIQDGIDFGHTSLYTDPEGGILFYQAHMGQATLERATFDTGKLRFEKLFSEGENGMVSDYTPVESIVKGAVKLNFGRIYQDLGVEDYDKIIYGMTHAGQDFAKEQTPDKELLAALDQVITYGGAVDAVNVLGIGADPGTIPFDTLLKSLDVWGGAEYKVDSKSFRDIDGDGRQECLIHLVKVDNTQPNDKFLIMNLEDGKMYAYILDNMTGYELNNNGVFTSKDKSENSFRVVFDEDECLSYFVD
jgi:hypothetical protein